MLRVRKKKGNQQRVKYMGEFLLKTFIDNIIVCILFLSIFSLFESSYPWGALGSVMLGIAIYGGFALILTPVRDKNIL